MKLVDETREKNKQQKEKQEITRKAKAISSNANLKLILAYFLVSRSNLRAIRRPASAYGRV
jgi:hypothetical protein